MYIDYVILSSYGKRMKYTWRETSSWKAMCNQGRMQINVRNSPFIGTILPIHESLHSLHHWTSPSFMHALNSNNTIPIMDNTPVPYLIPCYNLPEPVLYLT
jgi:hypothetical protein